jgi:hypothetical protein
MNSQKKEKNVKESFGERWSDQIRNQPGNVLFFGVIFILYILAIISNFKFINKCNINGKWIHYIMAIFTAPHYWSKTFLWPSLCGLVENASETTKSN